MDYTIVLHNSVASSVGGASKAGNVGESERHYGARSLTQQDAVSHARVAVTNESSFFHSSIHRAVVSTVYDRLGSWDMGHYILLEYFILILIWRERTTTHLKKRKSRYQSLGSRIGFVFVGRLPFRLRPVTQTPRP